MPGWFTSFDTLEVFTALLAVATTVLTVATVWYAYIAARAFRLANLPKVRLKWHTAPGDLDACKLGVSLREDFGSPVMLHWATVWFDGHTAIGLDGMEPVPGAKEWVWVVPGNQNRMLDGDIMALVGVCDVDLPAEVEYRVTVCVSHAKVPRTRETLRFEGLVSVGDFRDVREMAPALSEIKVGRLRRVWGWWKRKAIQARVDLGGDDPEG